jgi:glycosyltransferase involved in cell wall biosynthesis
MLETLARAGRDAQLLTYAHGAEHEELGFALHRGAEVVRYRSLRSGPSAHRLLADAALSASALRLVRALRPSLVVAHHVEAAAIALLLRARFGVPFVFFAHTDLAAELPTYAPAAAQRALRSAGGRLDALLVRRADAVAAISPLLAERLRPLAASAPDKVEVVAPPWPIPAPSAEGERAASRAALGLPSRACVLLYAGNLDRYQGWEEVLAALPAIGAREPGLIWLVATNSDPAPLLAEARRAGVAELIRLHALDAEVARRAVHAAADLAIVPRRSPGGLPIKLLDAMARGVACVAAQAAGAGLPIAHTVELAAGNDARALAAAALRVLSRAPHERAAMARRARSYVADAHGAEPFLRAFDRVCLTAAQIF